MMTTLSRNILKLVALTAILALPATALGASGKFEKSIDVDGGAVVHVNNDSGTVRVTGGDVDKVTIRAHIRIKERMARTDPSRAQKIVNGIKRVPPISVEGNRIKITKIERRAYQKHASISYDIIVPRNSDVEVHSVSGNVVVSGVTGDVNATSDSGKVTLADARADNEGTPAA